MRPLFSSRPARGRVDHQRELPTVSARAAGACSFMHAERILYNLEAVQRRIADAARRSGRPTEAIRLIAVTKKTPIEWIGPLVACGVRDLGENYPQELWAKVEALPDLRETVRWHLIGHLQTNKVKKTLPMVRLIHSVDSLKLLRALDEAARTVSEPPSVCLQVNTSDEPSKHGWTPEQIMNEAERIAACKAIPIVGLDDDGRTREHGGNGPGLVRAAA